MIKFELSKITNSTEKAVATGSTVSAEGQALVNDVVNGGVKPATGAANEQFVGVAFAQQLTPTAFPKVDEPVVGAGNTAALAFTPIGGTLRIIRTDTGATLAAGTPAGDATKYSISGTTVTVNSALVGVTLRAFYRFVPTTLQAKAVQGDIPPGGAAALILNSVGVVTKGEIVTTEFDPSVDWSTVAGNVNVTCLVNGVFTVGGSGAVVPNARVTMLPSAAAPYLGLEFAV